ncbi:hypothetical protein SO694_00017450 [Aureococcus anophagefferens]|uniref:Uncharacterized protein n=1 Tax=Aureococcus anophagefferens TaxID=44056 RepID=A0ABR1G1M3_AURAN
MLRIVVCVCFAAARPEHDHARQEHDRARQRHDHRHDRRHELLPARSRDGVGMARGLIGPCGAVRVASAGEQVAVEAAATPIALSSAAARDNGRWPRSAGPLPPRLVGPVDALTVYSPLLELAPSSLFHGLRSAVHGPRANASRVLLLLQDNPNKRPWADEELRGERIQVDAGFARQIGIGNALDAYSSAFLEAAALDRRLVVQGRIYERLCALVTCGLAAAAPPGPADDVEDRNNCCFKWHGGRRVEDDLRPALARVLAALGCAIDGASRRSRDDAAGEALACARSRVPRRAATGDGARRRRDRASSGTCCPSTAARRLDAGGGPPRRYDGDGARFARALLEPPRAPLFDAAVHLRTIACPAASSGRGAPVRAGSARPRGARAARFLEKRGKALRDGDGDYQAARWASTREAGGVVACLVRQLQRFAVASAATQRGGLRLRGQRAREARARRGLRAAFEREPTPHEVMYRHWIARGPRLPEDFWWRLLGATADWIFMARAARVYNIKGTGARSDQTPSSFSRTAGLRGNASLFSLFREAAGDGALPTACQWTRRDFY